MSRDAEARIDASGAGMGVRWELGPMSKPFVLYVTGMMKPTYAWGLASHIIKKTPTSAILRSAHPITPAFPTTGTSSPPPPHLQVFYHTPSSHHSASRPAFTTTTSLELNNKLVNLAKHARYDEAYRLCNHLIKNKILIKHHSVYEKAALAGVDLGRTNEGLERFVLWFSLVPDRYELSSRSSSSSSPELTTTSTTTQQQQRRRRYYIYSDTRFTLLRCGNPRAYLTYIMVFGNMMASKGFITISLLEIARVVVMFGRMEVVIDYFKKLEETTAYYYWERERQVGVGCWVLTWFWEVIVKLYLERGWVNLAFAVVKEKNGKFGLLDDELLKVLLRELEGRGDAGRVSVVRGLLDRSAAAAKEVSTT